MTYTPGNLETPFAPMPLWVSKQLGTKTGALKVYAHLHRYTTMKYKTASPSLETLAGEMGVNVRTAQRWIRDLEAEGLVVVEQRRNQSSVYHLVKTPPEVTHLVKVGDTSVTQVEEGVEEESQDADPCCKSPATDKARAQDDPNTLAPQGVVKSGPEEARVKAPSNPPLSRNPVTSSKNDAQHKRNDRVSDRVIRAGMRVGGFKTRAEVVNWLTEYRPYEKPSAIGSRPMIDYWGALRRMFAGIEGVPKHSDTDAYELIAHAKTTSAGMDWLVEYVRDFQRAALGAGGETPVLVDVPWIDGEPSESPALAW